MKRINKYFNAFKEGWCTCGSIIGVIFTFISLCLSFILICYGYETDFIELYIMGAIMFSFYSLYLFIEIRCFLRNRKDKK